ncbi:MAG: hypothetical protein ACPG77_15775 [Nannocystaceae bacterium]
MTDAPARKLTLSQKVVAKLFDFYFRASQGYEAIATEEMMYVFGLKGFMAWGAAVGGTVELLIDRYGEAYTQLILGFGGLWNGCRYCAYGHTLVCNLIKFRDDNELFPVDPVAMRDLLELRDDEICERIEALLAGPEWELPRRLLLREFELRMGSAEGETEDDDYLRLALDAWEWMNECTIIIGVDIEPDQVPPLSPIAKDVELLTRYHAARDEQRNKT